jgi:hypothetical protein
MSSLGCASLRASLASLVVLAACTDGSRYSPSLTQVRVGDVEVALEAMPFIPEDVFVPGITVAPAHAPQGGGAGRSMMTDLTFLADLDDPEALKEHATNPYETVPGSLFDESQEKDVEYTDVSQGQLGDCYVAAGLSAALFADVDHVMRDGMIREVRDGNGNAVEFMVRFYDAWGDPIDVAVDADLVRDGDYPAYMQSTDSVVGDEEWAPSLVEKAYAQWQGGYEKIGGGGYAGDVLQALTGSNAAYRSIKSYSEGTIYKAIEGNLVANKPVVSCTYGEDDGVDYSGTEIHAYHCYSTHGVRTDSAGKRYVTLRNPWASGEPAGNGADDGIFEIPMSEYMRLYSDLSLGGGYEPDHTAPAEVADLAVAQGDAGPTATWTAPGDDDDSGLALHYDLRVSTAPITSSTFYTDTRITVADPQVPGTAESVALTGLAADTVYYVAVRAEDESGNVAAISNVAVFDPNAVPAEE